MLSVEAEKIMAAAGRPAGCWSRSLAPAANRRSAGPALRLGQVPSGGPGSRCGHRLPGGGQRWSLRRSCTSPTSRGFSGPSPTTTAWRRVYERFSRLPGSRGRWWPKCFRGKNSSSAPSSIFQFGPVILLGVGGTGVEIYKDTTTRMAPLKASDVASMLGCLRGSRLFTGHRGAAGVNSAS